MKDYDYESVFNILDDIGITVNPELELEEGMTMAEILKQHKTMRRALVLLLISGYVSEKILKQAVSISHGFE